MSNAHISASQSWAKLSSIQIGGSICLPVIVTGHLICQEYGMMTAIASILFGNFLLLCLALIASYMGSVSRKNTVEHATIYFGEQSSYLFATLMTLTMLGWFAIQLNMMHESLVLVLNSFGMSQLSGVISLFLLGFITAWLVRKGLSIMGRMAEICVPALLLTLAYAIYSAPLPVAPKILASSFTCQAITFVMAINIAAIVDMPNLYRFARSKKDALIATVLVFGVGQPMIEGVGVYLAASLPHLGLIDALNGGRTDFWIPLFLLIGGWITNNGNLFSATVSSEKLLPFLTREHRSIILGILGTSIACANPASNLETTVNIMGIAIASMGGVILSGHVIALAKKDEGFIGYLLCWGIGALIGYYGEYYKTAVTGITILDAFFVSMILTSLKSFMNKKELWSYLPLRT